MVDVEATFYQVKVLNSQRSFMGYLLRNNNDLNGELVDYEMDVHVLGSSFPGCCNYALRRTAIHNAPNYDTEVAEILSHKFYVDYLPKSVESDEIAVQPIKDVKRMWGEGGFNPTKFICNRKEVLQSLPECHRRSEVKNSNLDGSLPLERALAISWDIDKDMFKANDTQSNSLNDQFYLWPPWISGTIYHEGEEIATATLLTWSWLGWNSTRQNW